MDSTLNSTLRLISLPPSSSSLLTKGLVFPKPNAVILRVSIPFFVRKSFTASALRWERDMVAAEIATERLILRPLSLRDCALIQAAARRREVAYRHPLLDPKFHIDSDEYVFTDDEIKQLVDDFIGAAKLAKQAGFTFVDVKH